MTITGAPRTRSRGTDNLQAYLKVYEGVGYARQGTKEANAEAKRFTRKPSPWTQIGQYLNADLARALHLDLFYGASESPQETLSKAMKLAQKLSNWTTPRLRPTPL